MSIEKDVKRYEKAAIAAIYVRRGNPVKAIEAIEDFYKQISGKNLPDSISNQLSSAKKYARVFGQPAVWNEYPDIARAISTYASKYPLPLLDDLEKKI